MLTKIVLEGFGYYNTAMGTIKTVVNDASVTDFINTVGDETRRNDGFTLLKLFEKITGEKPKMWGTSIIGFGKYHYKSERSRQEGDWPLTGFSPRKQNLTIYLMTGADKEKALLAKLGKHSVSTGSCLYIKKLDGVDMKVLEQIIKKSFEEAKRTLT